MSGGKFNIFLTKNTAKNAPKHAISSKETTLFLGRGLLKMAGFAQGISNFEGLVTLTLDRFILHTVMHTHRPLRTRQISFKSKKLFVDGRTCVHTHVRRYGHLRPALLGGVCQRVDLKRQHCSKYFILCLLWHIYSFIYLGRKCYCHCHSM